MSDPKIAKIGHSWWFGILPLALSLSVQPAFAETSGVSPLSSVRDILHEASNVIQNTPDGKFGRHEASGRRTKVYLLGEIARLQGEIKDKDGLRHSKHWILTLYEDNGQRAKFHLSRTLASIAWHQMNAGFAEDGRMTLEHALNAARSLQDEKLRDSSLKYIAYVLVKGGMTSKAIETTHRITHPETKGYALLVTAHVVVKKGNLQQVAEIVSEAHKEVELIEIPISKTNALRNIADIQVKIGNWEAAKTTLEYVRKEANHIPDVAGMVIMLRDLARIHKTVGNHLQASDLFQEIINIAQTVSDQKKRINIYLNLSAYSRSFLRDDTRATEFLRVAVESAQSIDRPWEKAWSLMWVANSYIVFGDKENANRLVLLALESVDHVESKDQKASVLWSIGQRLVNWSTVEQAIIDSIQEAIDTIPEDITMKANVLQTLVTLQAHSGQLDRALNNSLLIRGNPWERARALQEIAKAKIRVDGKKNVFAWTREFEEPQEKVRVLLGVAEGLLSMSGADDGSTI